MSSAPSNEHGDSPSTAEVAASLAQLQARQRALHEALTRRNASDAESASAVEATFSQLPEYIAKLQRVQQSMDTLAARTSQMRARCIALSEQG